MQCKSWSDQIIQLFAEYIIYEIHYPIFGRQAIKLKKIIEDAY